MLSGQANPSIKKEKRRCPHFVQDDVCFRCQITVAEHLDPAWSGWLGELRIHHTDRGSVLSGSVADQAALYDVIVKLRDLGATLVAEHAGEDPPWEAGRGGHVSPRIGSSPSRKVTRTSRASRTASTPSSVTISRRIG